MNPSNFLRSFKIIYLALAAGMLVFSGIAIFITKDKQFFQIPGVEDIFVIIVPVVLAAGMGAGNFLFKKLLSPVKKGEKTLQQKISIYFSSSIIRFALTEGPVLLAIVALLQTNNLFYMIFVAVGLLFYFTLNPKEERIARDLELTYDQKSELGMK
jgi:hypothetical protein